MTPEEQAAADLAAKELAEKEAAAKLKQTKPEDADMIAKLVAEKVEEQIKEAKEKLNSAYDARDKALKRAEALEKKEREAELKILEESGKHKEAFDLRIAEANTKYDELLSKFHKLEEGNLELSRDAQIRDLLRGQEFRNDKAAALAFKDISAELIRNDQGVWVHRSGVNIKDFVTTFTANEDNAFLFKVKTSTGGGSSNSTPSNKTTALRNKTQAEVLEMAAQGKLPARK